MVHHRTEQKSKMKENMENEVIPLSKNAMESREATVDVKRLFLFHYPLNLESEKYNIHNVTSFTNGGTITTTCFRCQCTLADLRGGWGPAQQIVL